MGRKKIDLEIKALQERIEVSREVLADPKSNQLDLIIAKSRINIYNEMLKRKLLEREKTIGKEQRKPKRK